MMSAGASELGAVLALILFAAILLVLGRRSGVRKGRAGASPEPNDAGSRASPLSGPLILIGPPPRTRYPLLFAHGYFGFDRLKTPRAEHDYFRGVRTRLEALGYRVHVARVSPAGGIERRAAQLREQVAAIDAPRVNIIAHSMGGLDARLAIARLGLAERVASLTTVGTPHRGTPLADAALAFGAFRHFRRLLDSLGADVDGLYDLSTIRMEEFNRRVLDAPGVHYGSVVGVVNPGVVSANALLAPGHAYLLRKVGPNDGIVPAVSQRWGEVISEVEADHWAQIGWFGRFDVQGFYAGLAEYLARKDL